MDVTALNLLIARLEDIKLNHCKTLQETIFFDGVLSLIEGGKFLEKEKEQITRAFINGQNSNGTSEEVEQYYYKVHNQQ